MLLWICHIDRQTNLARPCCATSWQLHNPWLACWQSGASIACWQVEERTQTAYFNRFLRRFCNTKQRTRLVVNSEEKKLNCLLVELRVFSCILRSPVADCEALNTLVTIPFLFMLEMHRRLNASQRQEYINDSYLRKVLSSNTSSDPAEKNIVD